MFKEENIILCLKNKDIWRNVRDSIEDISITLFTFIKILSIDGGKLISTFTHVLQNKDNYVHPSYLRFQLFDYMSMEYDNHKKETLEVLEKIQKGFKEYQSIEGELETLFAKCIVNYRNKDWKIFDDIYKNEIMIKLIELKSNDTYQIENKEKFIILFENKVKYKYIKYKVKLGILSDDELSDIDQIIFDFKKQNYFFYIIKSCFIVSEYYLQKSKIKKGNIENNEEFEKHLDYLNFAYYISLRLCKTSQKYVNYTKNFIAKKYKLINKDNSKEKKDRIKILCDKYGIVYVDNQNNYF
jgi:hypothetical protein